MARYITNILATKKSKMTSSLPPHPNLLTFLREFYAQKWYLFNVFLHWKDTLLETADKKFQAKFGISIS